MDKAKNIEEVIKKLTTITRQAKIHGGVSVLHNLIKEENTEEVFVLLEDALKVIYRLELKNKEYLDMFCGTAQASTNCNDF